MCVTKELISCYIVHNNLTWQVVNVSQEESTGQMVLRVRDATNTRILTKKVFHLSSVVH